MTSAPRTSDRTLLGTYLDAVRFFAAMAVVFGHARLHAFGNKETEPLSISQAIIYHTGDLAHLAVIIFFVISGYLVGGKLYKAHRPQFARKYLLDRATRIYTVALPMLLFGFATMLLQQKLYGQAISLRGDTCDGTAAELVGSLAFMHSGIMPGACFNSPFWSLIYEVFYYLFFFAVALALTTSDRRSRYVATAAAVALAVYGLFEPDTLWAYATIWLLGMAIAARSPLAGRQSLFTATVIVLLFVQTALRLDNPEAKWELVMSLLMAGSILLLRRCDTITVPRQVSLWLAAGAGMSYSLYLAHAPAMNLLRSVVEGETATKLGVPLSAGTPLHWYAAFIVAGTAAGVLCWLFFERHTMPIRRWAEGRIGILHQPVPDNLTGELPPRLATQPEQVRLP